MTITSAGYDGTVTQEDWARMAGFFGSDTGVATSTDLVATGVAGTRVVSVSPGTAWGWGVLDTLTDSNTVALTANGSGSTRWDAIVLRRNWSTKVTTLAAVAGSSVEAVPSLTVTPGSQSDQVIALVAVPAGATSLVGATVRRYVQWPAQMTAGLYPPDSPSYMQRWVDLSSTPSGVMKQWSGSTWLDPLNPPYTALTLGSGLASVSTPVGFRVVQGRVELRGIIARAAGFASGGSATLFTLPLGARPLEGYRRKVATSGGSSPFVDATLDITAAGVAVVYVGAQSTPITAVYLDGISFAV